MSNKISRPVAFLVLLLPASFVVAQEVWTFTPKLRYDSGQTSATQMAFEAYIEASSSDTSASSLWFTSGEFAMLFDSSTLDDDDLTALLAGYTGSQADLKGSVLSSYDSYTEDQKLILSYTKAPGSAPTRSCVPVGGSCEIVLGTFTIPNIVSGTNLRVAWGRLDNLSNPDHVSNPATPDSPFKASFSPSGFTGTLDVDVTDTVLTFPPPAPVVTMSATKTAVDEGIVATIAVRVFPTPASALTLNYTIEADTDVATADAATADYSDANSGGITISAMSATADVEIAVIADNLAEIAEVFVVRLNSVTATDGSTVLLSTEVTNAVTIAASDTPEVALEGPVDVVVEGQTATYTMSLSTEPTENVVLDYTITGTAMATTHYGDPASGTATVDTALHTVTILSGATSGTFTILTRAGAGGESIIVTLSNPTGGGGETPTFAAGADSVAVTTNVMVAVNLDINRDGVVTGHDAVILYFASPLAGVRSTLSRPRGRMNTLSVYADSTGRPTVVTDAQLVDMVAAADVLLENDPDTVDINRNGSVTGHDAVILYFASPLAGVRSTLSRPRGRMNTLSAYAQPPVGKSVTDVQLVDMVAAAELLLSS